MHKSTICLWYDCNALEATQSYTPTFADSAVGAVYHAPSDYPDSQQGQVLTVAFAELGIPCLGINSGPNFKRS